MADQLLNPTQLHTTRQHIDNLLQAEGEDAGSELRDSKYIRHPTEPGVMRLADLVNKGALFDLFYTHPKVLAAVKHVIRDRFKLSSLNYRAALPGAGAQKLHVDWREAVANGHYTVCNSIWLLDDFTADNGATRFVPGTHRNTQLPAEVMADPYDNHPEEKLLIAPAGTVVVFNSHLWHGGTINNSFRQRRAIHSYFCRYDVPQQVDQQKYLRAETRERLGEDILALLG